MGRSPAMNPQAVLVTGVVLLSAARSGSAADAAPPALHVAAVQMRSSRDLRDNVARIRKHLHACAARGVRVAVFPECALTGYYGDLIPRLSAEELAGAERQVAEACRAAGIYAVVGMPHRDG